MLLDEASALLIGAALILDGPQRWARHAYALDGRGRSVVVDDPRATRFCLAGAVLRAEHKTHGTPMPIRTDPSPEADDLLAPIAPPGAPMRLHIALQILAVASGWELQKLGVRFILIDAATEDRVPSVLHRSLILGLHRKARFTECDRAIAVALSIITWIATNDDRLDQSVRDEAIDS